MNNYDLKVIEVSAPRYPIGERAVFLKLRRFDNQTTAAENFGSL